jgi:hypothetical protein
MTAPANRRLSALRWVASSVVALLAAVLFAPHTPTPAAGQEAPANALPPELDRVPRDAAFVLSVRVAEFWGSDEARPLREVMAKQGEILRDLEQATGLGPADVERLTLIVPTVERGGPTTPAVLVTTGKAYDRTTILKGLKARPPDSVGPGEKAPYYRCEEFLNATLFFLDDRNLLVLPPIEGDPSGSALTLLGQALRRAPHGPLDYALARAAKKHVAVAGLNVPAVVRLLPEQLPVQVRPFQALFQAEAATATLDVTDTTRLEVRLQFADAAAARKARPAIFNLILVGRGVLAKVASDLAHSRDEDSAPLLALVHQAEAALKDAAVGSRGDRVDIDLGVKTDKVLALAIAQIAAHARYAASRTQSQNNLKQIALAFHNHNDAFAHMPPAALCDPKGKPLLSWRVAILPFVEEEALYKQFKLDEPWDSDNNKKLLDKMPKLYALPGVKIKGQGFTAYQVFVGKDALFDGDRKPRIPASIPDGTSNTILVVEAAETVPWTKPADVPFGDKDPRSQIGGWYGHVVNVALCDGSVRSINLKKISKETLRNAIMPADGNVLGPDW